MHEGRFPGAVSAGQPLSVSPRKSSKSTFRTAPVPVKLLLTIVTIG